MKNRPLVVVGCLFLTSLGSVSALALGPEEGPSRAGLEVDAQAVLEEGVRPQLVTVHITEEHSEELRAKHLEQADALASRGGAPTRLYAPGGPPLPIYLNRWGGIYHRGQDNPVHNFSSIVQGSSATVGPFPGNDYQWADVLECVQDKFSAFNVYVTDIEPTEAGYVEAVVGGTPDQIGQPFGVGGVAPYDSFGCQVIDTAVVYAFAGVYGTSPGGLNALCETVSQEVAHAFTLDHELLCEDPMTYLDGCGAKDFQNVTAPCGEFEERECYCGDAGGQNSVQSMLTLLGANEGVEPPPPPADYEPPMLEFVQPENESTHLAGEPLRVEVIATDDAGLVSVQLHWHLSGTAMYCPGNDETWSCVIQGQRYIWDIDVGAGLREFNIEARDVVGNVTTTETRWVWLGESLDEERPEDDVPPEVTIISPAPLTTFYERVDFELVATAYDAHTGIIGAQLQFESPWGVRAVGCPVESDFISCTVEGGTYTWRAYSGRSDKTFTVLAVDHLGNVGVSEPLPILVDNATADVFPDEDDLEPNDTWDFPTALECGAEQELLTHAADPDWFEFDAPAGHKVTVTLDGQRGDSLDMFVHLGPTNVGVLVQSLHEAGEPTIISYFQPEAGARVRVQPSGGLAGSYTLNVGCEEPPPPPAPDEPAPGLDLSALGLTCSHVAIGSSSTPLAGFALLWLSLAIVARRAPRTGSGPRRLSKRS